jgi:hypothetical protein
MLYEVAYYSDFIYINVYSSNLHTAANDLSTLFSLESRNGLSQDINKPISSI